MVLVVAGVLVGASCLHAQQANPTEYEVKAAYLYNFGKFVEWPAKVTAASESAPRDPGDARQHKCLDGE